MGKKVIGIGRKVAGPTGSWRRRWVSLLTLAVIVGAGLFFVRTVLAVHDTGVFQLDGNADTATNSTPPATDDWDKVCYTHAITPVSQGGSGLTPAAALALCGIGTGVATTATATSWISEPDRQATIFTGGGSKDPTDINQWAWKNDPLAGDELHGGLPDKDNLLHAFAVRYKLPDSATCPSGTATDCHVLYFGSDRFDNSGDAVQGFWFLQNDISLGSNKVGGGTGFASGGDPEFHRDGDLLVISDFSNGGDVALINIYVWDFDCVRDGNPDAGCKADNIRLLAESPVGGSDCRTIGTADRACGRVNDSPIIMPWAFNDKTNPPPPPDNQALVNEFGEFGVNLSQLGLSGACFATLVSETRSSTSLSAQLKDFVIGRFAVCAGTLETQASTNGTVAPGVPVTDRAIVQITGADSPADPLGTVTFHLCGPGTSAPNCDGTPGNVGTQVGVAVDLTNAQCSPVSPNDIDGLRCAVSLSVNQTGLTGIRGPLAPGFYCFRATATLTNYASPAPHTNTTTECFRVQDTSGITTVQRWLPNDEATVTLGSGNTPTGSVIFSLYPNGTCTGTPVTFGPITLDGTGKALTSNITQILTTGTTTISWRVTFTPTDTSGVVGSTSNCEISTLNINNVGIP